MHMVDKYQHFAGNIARMRKGGNRSRAQTVCVGNPRAAESPITRRTLKNNIKMDIKEIAWNGVE
jgi:hypothetical protein